MDPITIGLIAAAALLIVLLVGIPIGYGMTLVGVVGLWIVGGDRVAVTALQRLPFSAVVTITLVVVPLFVIMGEFATLGGVAEDTFLALRTLGGRMRGSLAMATIAACGAFGAVSGSSVATALTIGKPALAEMSRYGYGKRLSLGAVAAGGTIGALMPPSIILILYALITNVSIGDVFLAGAVPAILTVTVYAALIAIVSRVKPNSAPGGSPSSLSERIRILPKLIPVAILAAIVLGSLFLGLVSLTEIAGLGAFAAIALWLWQKGVKKRNWGGATNTVMTAVRITSMIGMLLIGAQIFTNFLSYSRLPIRMSAILVDLGVTPLIFIVFSGLLFILLGMFFETMSMLLLTIPFLATALQNVGIDTIWYAIFFVKVAEIGLVTPPIGLNVYVIKGIAPEASLKDIFYGAGLFILADLVVIALIVAFPQIVLWLPTTLG